MFLYCSLTWKLIWLLWFYTKTRVISLLSFKVISSTWSILYLWYEYLGTVGRCISMQNKLTRLWRRVLQCNSCLQITQDFTECLLPWTKWLQGVMMLSKDKSGCKLQWHIKHLHDLRNFFIKSSCNEAGEAVPSAALNGMEKKCINDTLTCWKDTDRCDRLRQHGESKQIYYASDNIADNSKGSLQICARGWRTPKSHCNCKPLVGELSGKHITVVSNVASCTFFS